MRGFTRCIKLRLTVVSFCGVGLLFLVPPFVLAQTGELRGTIRDASGSPLPGINVVLEGTTRGDATDLGGHYRIEQVPAGSYTVRASAVGFRQERHPVTISAGEVVTLDFILQDIALESGEVVVTAARREQRFSEAPVSINIVQPRELEARNITSLDDALRYVPGVQLSDNQVNIRGSSGFSFNTGSRVLLLLDGMPLLSPDREGIPHDALPMAQVARVEVVKGAGSALYGGGALGGVINIITKDFTDRPETAIRLFGGAYEPVRYALWREAWDEADDPRRFGGGTLTHARRLGSKGGMWLSAAYREDQGYTNFHKEKDLDTFFKLGWHPTSSLRFGLLGGWTWRKSDSFLYWNGARDALNPGELEFGGVRARGTNDNQINLFNLMPSFSHVISGSLFYSIKGRLIAVIIQPLEDDGTPKPVADGTVGARYGGEVQINWVPRPGQHITAGITGDALLTESSFFQPDSVESTARSQPERAAFVQVEQRLFDRLDLVAGVRYDTYEIDTTDVERKLSPKINASLRIIDGLTLRAAYGEGFRVPSLGERFVNNQAFLPIIANLDLRPEESTSYEVGLRSLVPLTDRIRTMLDLAAFWNHYERLVEPRFIPEEQAFQFVNLTKARIRGVEAGFDAVLDENRLSIGIGYTYLDAEDLTDRRPLVFRSRHLLKASLSATLIGPLSLGLDFRYASAPERVDSDFSRFVRDAELVGSRRVLDARVGLRWPHVGVAFLVKNALEYYYVERPAILAPPRHFILQLQADF
ncbi:MAG: TonB-dependent receptor domain-containing protein [Rhodothermales bacterium]